MLNSGMVIANIFYRRNLVIFKKGIRLSNDSLCNYFSALSIILIC
jgi:hypothetical protein